MTDLNVAIVTGVSRGLGEAIAQRLLADGFTVLGLGRTSSPRLGGPAYEFVAVDLADPESAAVLVAERFAAVADTGPAYAVLVNNAAAVEPIGRLGHVPDALLARAFAVNLVAPVVLANAFCRAFPAAHGERRIINVSSGSAARVGPGAGHYSMAKAGLEMLTAALAVERTDPGFRAITIRPGVIDTQMQVTMRTQSPDVLPMVPMFVGFHRSGQLVRAETTAGVIVDRLVHAPVEHGRTYTYQELAA